MQSSGANAVRLWAGTNALENLGKLKILIIGAGGLGCEILKNLASCGFKDLHIIDMDVIEMTNLNRQFLFRQEDIGEFKADVAAEIVCRNYLTPVKSHVNYIQNMPDSFYQGFHIVVCGLDNVEARRWINAKIVQLCYADPNPSGLRPLIDGGSEGFRGQCRVILPGITPCYECMLSLIVGDSASNYPLCTIASIPRLPEHCIQWASIVRWPQIFGSQITPDFENADHMHWLYETASKRASQFNIEGVTLELVYGVLKRIIPAVASTNAVIAASCSLEVLKLSTGTYDPINNYLMYAGDVGIFSSVFKFEKRDDCPVCGNQSILVRTQGRQTLREFLKEVMTMHKLGNVANNNILPSASMVGGSALYIAKPQSLELQTSKNLSKPLSELISQQSTEIALTHPGITFPIRLSIILD